FTGSGKEVAVTGSGYQLQGKFKENGDELNLEESPVERKLVAIAAFCNDASIKEGQGEGNQTDKVASKEEKNKKSRKEEEDDGPEITGDPTEAAMLVLGKKAKVKEKEPFSQYKLLDDLPFKSEQKFRATLVETEEGQEIFAIGAPERILELSKEYLSPNGAEKMTDEKKKE